MTDLKPCPFCGGEASVQTTYGYGVSEAFCLDCGAHTGHPPGGCTEAEAIAAWNARAERTCRNIAEPDEMSDKSFTCSECGARGPYGEGTYHIGGCEEIDGKLMLWDSWPVYKFCPNCGARVEVVE